MKELVIVRGKNFREDLKLKWRLCRSGDLLKKCEPVPKAALEELNVVYLIRSPVSSTHGYTSALALET